ncbi:MAG: aldo/keto reductase [Dehalococcoidales bacterium]|nr:MAG: aldo/keto reductase [Dehalococcoidales bacterium]
MEYRTLGKTGLRVSEIGFGCGNVGGLLVRGTEQEQLEAVELALTLGINYFDTAPAYGNGQSEINLGKVLKQIKENVFVATKVQIGIDDSKDIKDCVRKSLETSLNRLGRDYVDVFQLHTPISPEAGSSGQNWRLSLEQVLGKNGVVEAFEAVRSEGLVRFLGFTGLGDTDALHEVIHSGCFDLVQSYFNLLNPSAGIAVPAGFKGQDFRQLINVATENDMGVVIIRVMAGGALGGSVARTGYAAPFLGGGLTPGSEYNDDEARAVKLDFLLNGDLNSLPQAAVRFALDNPNVSTVLVGYSNNAQITDAAACSGMKPIPESKLERLTRLWASDFST